MSDYDFVSGWEAAFQQVSKWLREERPRPPQRRTPTGRTVKETIDLGSPFVDSSGIAQKIYHQDGCNANELPPGYPCSCGVDGALNRLAIAFTEVLDDYRRPGSAGRS